MSPRRLLPALLALPLAGCLAGAPLGTGTVELQSAASVPVRVRIAPFEPGKSVAEGQIVVDEALGPRGRASLTLPAGRYSVEGVAATPKGEAAFSAFTVERDQPLGLMLNEVMEPYKGLGEEAQLEQVRLLSWETN